MVHRVFEEIQDALTSGCRQVYGERLVGVVVFGSVALGRMRPDSDIDVLVIAEPLPHGRIPRMHEFSEVESRVGPALKRAEEHGVTTRLSPIVRTREDLKYSGFLLFDIACDGRILYDTDNQIEQILADVRRRLDERGAQRRTKSGAQYWVLDPNVKPGQVIEL